MIARLGISIHADECRAVLVRGRDVRWRAAIERASAVPLSDTLSSLLASLPIRSGVRRATVAMGPSVCQVKQLEGLPPVGDAATLTRLVRENSAAFFLQGGHRLAISDVTRVEGNAVWAAAFDHDVCATAIHVLKRKKFFNVRIVPSVVAIGAVSSARATQWKDGEQTLEIRTNDQRSVVHVRRVTEMVEGSPPLIGPITQLGDEAWVNAAAFGATLIPRSAPFVWRPAPDPKRAVRAQRLRVAALLMMCALSAVSAVAAPGLRATRFIQRASGERDALRASQTEYARTQSELFRMAVTIDRVERFQAQRGKLTVFLGALSQALPESTALVSLRVDSLEGNFVALTPHAADILPQLASVSELAAPRIVGSLMKEALGTAQVERATVRFKRPSVREKPSGKPTDRGAKKSE